MPLSFLQKTGFTALIKASYNGHINVAEALLKANGIDVNKVTVSVEMLIPPHLVVVGRFCPLL